MTVRGFTLNNGATAATATMTGTVPIAASAGDVLVVCSSENTSTHTHAISGGGTVTWTVRSGPDDNSTNLRSYVWTATAASDSPGATITVTTSAGTGRLVGAGAAVTGEVEAGVLVGLTTQTTAGTSMPFPSVTVPDTRGWTLLGLALMRTGTTTAATMATPPTGTTVDATSTTAIATQPEYSAVLLNANSTVTSGAQTPGTGTASASATDATLYAVALSPTLAATGSISLGGTGTPRSVATATGTVSLGGTSTVSSVSVVPSPGVIALGGTGTAKGRVASVTGSVSLGGTVSTSAAPTLVDVFDFYLDAAGNLDRWMRGTTTGPGVPGAPSNVQAVLSGTTVTLSWSPPTNTGGSAITGYTTAIEGGATHTLGATASSDTFTVAGGGPFNLSVFATNIVGNGPKAGVTTSATKYRFPGDPLPLLTGNILWGATENDNDGTLLTTSNEFCAPEADTGKKYAVIKIFYAGSTVENCFIPSTGGIAKDVKAHRPKGHIVLANVAIQASTSPHFNTWRLAGNVADSVVHSTYFNFIQWCEEGSDAPDCPIWLCMPHEAQQTSKTNMTTTSGMCPGDYGDLQRGFRQCMTDYAISKVGGDGSAYKWKRLAFMGVHVGDSFTSTAADHDVDNFYTSFSLGSGTAVGSPFAPKSVHDVIGGDPYQTIAGSTLPGRTGVPMWNNVAKALVAWAKSKGVPSIFAEYGIRQTDGDAADQLQIFFNALTNGTNDVVSAMYWNSGSGGTIAAGNTHFLLTDNFDNDPANPINSTALKDGAGNLIGLKTCFENIMKRTNVVRFWNLGSPGIPGGYSKPPGV